MNKSDTIGALAAALAKAQGSMTSASKTAANPFFKSRYADLSSIVDAIKRPLADNGLAYVQTTDIDEKGIVIETTLLHSSGEWISGRLCMKPVKDDPQAVGSAITYGRRYGLQAIVGLDTDDDDGNAASGKSEHKGHEHANGKDVQQKPTPIRQPEPQATPSVLPVQRTPPQTHIEADAAIAKSDLLNDIAKTAREAGVPIQDLNNYTTGYFNLSPYHKADVNQLTQLAEWVRGKAREKELEAKA